MARRYPCPQCARDMLLEKVHEGFEVPCPVCGHRFLVPIGLTAEVPAVQPTVPAALGPAPIRTMPPPVPGRIPGPVRSTGGVADEGMAALIWGIIGVVVCQFVGPVAWYLGHQVRAEARRAGREPPGAATAGWILGIIATILLLLTGCFAAMFIGIAASSGNF